MDLLGEEAAVGITWWRWKRALGQYFAQGGIGDGRRRRPEWLGDGGGDSVASELESEREGRVRAGLGRFDRLIRLKRIYNF
jgi:hypothetical protein